MSIRIERNPPITTVTICGPEVKNAVDRGTAEALADAFRAFEADGVRVVGDYVPRGAKAFVERDRGEKSEP